LATGVVNCEKWYKKSKGQLHLLFYIKGFIQTKGKRYGANYVPKLNKQTKWYQQTVVRNLKNAAFRGCIAS